MLIIKKYIIISGSSDAGSVGSWLSNFIKSQYYVVIKPNNLLTNNDQSQY